MKVSIIVPIYNVSEYIERCIKSVIAQSYNDIECILVDDCTPDDSIEKCQKMIDSYCGAIDFKIIHHKRNRGLSAARNTGTDAAQGKYIYYLDSDDEITPDCIQLLVHEVELNPEVELVQGNVHVIPYNKWYDLKIYQQPCYKEGNEWIRYNFFRIGEEFPVMAWNKLIRKDFLYINNISFKEGIIHEDELWTLLLVKKLRKYAIINEKTYRHYQREQSIMGEIANGQTNAIKRSAKSWMYICRIAFKQLDEPFIQLQLFKYLWFFLYNINYGSKMIEGLLAKTISIYALLRCGYKKLAFRCLKYYITEYLPNRQNLRDISEDILFRWEKESTIQESSSILTSNNRGK